MPRQPRFVAMTFDDGPDPVWTPRVIRALADADARATFFLMTTRARRHPDLVCEIVDHGHEVGLHCARHFRHTRTPRSIIERDTAEAVATLATFGLSPARWRLPWGATADWTESLARDHSLEIVGWSADTHDWRGDPAASMLAAVEPELGPGAVVLMHDGLGPGARRDDCRETERLIAPLAAAIRERGLEPESLARIGSSPPCP